jgi:hypothetical protein
MAEKLGYYVYALKDPEGGIFYVGKGKGNRVYQHAIAALVVGGESPEELKLNVIKRIQRRGHAVGIEIVRHSLTSKEAFEVEGAVMDILHLTGHHLTNKVRGKGANHGYAPLEELRARYAAKRLPRGGITEKVVLIRLNDPPSAMSEGEIYRRTREWWRRAQWREPEYAFTVYGGIVRRVFRIEPDSWEPDSKQLRWRFSAVRDPKMEERYNDCDVSGIMKPGDRFPLRYINC